jgi:zinc and cadmium transporter
VDLAALQKLSERFGPANSAYACTAFLSISAVLVFAVLGALRKLSLISEGVLSALMACAAGSLLGDVFLHALPEMDKSMDSWILVITGIFLFYLLDKLFTSDHSHTPTKSPVFLYLLADAAHNFMDGMAIAVAFRTTPILGITTSLAVLFHELPHELADFIVLIKSGRSLGKALWLQCLTGVVALAGTWVALADVSKEQVDRVGLPLVVGNFLYLAMVNILGELRAGKGGLISESVGFLLGAYLMLKLALLE